MVVVALFDNVVVGAEFVVIDVVVVVVTVVFAVFYPFGSKSFCLILRLVYGLMDKFERLWLARAQF